MTDIDLLRDHVSALFVLDDDERLVAINEPWDRSKPAPLVYVGRTLDAKLAVYWRYDMDRRLYRAISHLAREGVYDPAVYAELVGAGCIVEELCYAVPPMNTEHKQCIILRPDNIDDFDLYEFYWLKDEIHTDQPCCVYIEDERAVSVCRSVRISDGHEAGLETALEYRGKGYAKHVLFAWSMQVFAMNKIPLYSTLRTNAPSRRIAEKSQLHLFAEAFHISM